MVSQRQLALDISSKIEFTPADDRILVKPLKPVMVTKLLPTPPVQPAKTADEAEAQEPTTPSKQRVEANMQKGIVIKLGPAYNTINPNNIEVGDTVIHHKMAGIPFEILKDSRMLSRYEVQAVIKPKEEIVSQLSNFEGATK